MMLSMLKTLFAIVKKQLQDYLLQFQVGIRAQDMIIKNLTPYRFELICQFAHIFHIYAITISNFININYLHVKIVIYSIKEKVD